MWLTPKHMISFNVVEQDSGEGGGGGVEILKHKFSFKHLVSPRRPGPTPGNLGQSSNLSQDHF